MSSEWRIAITRYTGGAEYRLMRFDECFGQFNDIGELKKFSQMLKEDLDRKRDLLIRERVRKDYEEIIAVIKEIRP